MKNKGIIVFFTVVITALCLYYLSFTLVSNNVHEKATTYATDASGNVDFDKRQTYLDSVWREPVYNFLGIPFTYQEVKNTELGLGLDLQGGMHVTLEVSPVEIVKGLAGGSKDQVFNEAVEEAKERSKTVNDKFVNIFYQAWQEKAGDKALNTIFATAANRGRISLETSDAEILSIIDTEVENAIDRSFNILRTRIDRFGTSQPNIQRIQNTGRIQIELPGVDNAERVRNLLQGVAKLQFWQVAEIDEFGDALQQVNAFLVEEAKNQKASSPAAETTTSSDTTDLESDLAKQLAEGATDADSLGIEASPIFALLKANYGLVYELRDTIAINRVLNREDVKALLPRDVKFMWSVKPQVQDGMDLLELHAIKAPRGTDQAPLEGDVITDARQSLDQTSRPAVSMQMNAEGARRWRKLTAENIGKRIAVVLDNYVYTAPTVQGEIPSGQSEITGNFTMEEAKDLANILKSGTLPAPTNIVEEAIVGPTLGVEARNQGINSMVAGLVLVVLFMIAYYSKGGFVAIAALLFNIFFILGILAQLGAALTLPGIAGIVLTIGMSIDANVLIFERIKEELKNGAGILQAISSGYDKAFSAILDSNVTTFLTGAILYALGQVKGFAIVLMIGIASSFFSAVFITRVIVYWMSKKGEKSNISFATPFAKNLFSDLNIDFLGKRKVAYLISTGIIVIGMILALTSGIKFGVDFTGGRYYVVEFSESVPASELKVGLDSEFDGAVEVKTYGANNVLKVTTSYLVNEDNDEANREVEDKVRNGIAAVTGFSYLEDATKLSGNDFSITGSNKVGATVADDIKNSSLEAMFFSLIAIFLYILLRFRKWQFSLASIIALIHDTFFVIAAFAIASAFGATFEIDQVFIAAVLTVIGYSINDTVIVFDRIRENIANRGTSKIVKMFNDAINQTMARTLITSATTLIVVLVLLIFGGEVLRGFSFALLIGVLVGTYSSIYIATPVVVDLMKKEIESESEVPVK